MLSAGLRVCLKARPSASTSLPGSFSGTLCSAPRRRSHLVDFKLSNNLQSRYSQRRQYAAHDRDSPKPTLANTPKPAEGQLTESNSLKSIRKQLNDTYKTPTVGFISYLPASWIPYAELARLDKPTGTFLLWFPCAFSTIVAGSTASPLASLGEISATTALFLAGAFVMRGAGCTVNDLWDRNLDPYVERTKFRPIARGAVAPLQASTFLGFQLLTGLAILLQFPTSCLYYGIPSLLLVGIYPLMKRVTNYPQFVLGLTFSWGAIMGYPAMGIDLLSDVNALYSAACLYLSCIAWTVNYDMVYAHMDIKDDAKAGIKSIARAHEKNTKTVLGGLTAAQAILLAGTAHFAGAAWYMSLLCTYAVPANSFILMRDLDLKNVGSCMEYFKASAYLVGTVIVAVLLLAYSDKNRSAEGPTRTSTSELESSNSGILTPSSISP
jgi:4-hydroxybenzoate polyprenyltransferase